jgi:hypothetical protein
VAGEREEVVGQAVRGHATRMAKAIALCPRALLTPQAGRIPERGERGETNVPGWPRIEKVLLANTGYRTPFPAMGPYIQRCRDGQEDRWPTRAPRSPTTRDGTVARRWSRHSGEGCLCLAVWG